MFDFSIRFRWLFVSLIALSLIAPRWISPDSPRLSPETAQTRVAASGAGEGECGGGESPADGLADPAGHGDAHSGDYPQEMDKILSLFSPHWGVAAGPWDGIYFASLSPDPVFSFDRPPKMAPDPA